MKVFFIFIWAFIYPSSIKSKLFEYQKHIKKNWANIAFIQSLILLHNNSIISSPTVSVNAPGGNVLSLHTFLMRKYARGRSHFGVHFRQTIQPEMFIIGISPDSVQSLEFLFWPDWNLDFVWSRSKPDSSLDWVWTKFRF